MLVTISLLALLAPPPELLAGFADRPQEQQVQVIEALGCLARSDAGERDAALQAAAELLTQVSADKERTLRLQNAFQTAFLLCLDPPLFATLAPETVAAIDQAIETCFTLEELGTGDRWDPLAYAWGYFNHNLTADEMAAIRDRWAAIPVAERNPHYPYFIHIIDAAVKPLATIPLDDPERVRPLVEVGLPMLVELLDQPVAEGYAFHPPSHAVIIVGQIHEHLSASPTLRPLVEQHLGDREAMLARLTDSLVGGKGDPAALSETEWRFHTYIGRYSVNALARLGDTAALPAIEQTLGAFAQREANRGVLAYTRRAAAALGNAELRGELSDADLLWIARNCTGEPREFAETRLRQSLGVEADDDPVVVFYARRYLELVEALS